MKRMPIVPPHDHDDERFNDDNEFEIPADVVIGDTPTQLGTGGAWSDSYDSAATIIHCQIEYLGELYAGGNDGNIYVYNGTSWSLAYDSASSAIRSFCIFNGNLYAGATAASAAVGQNLIYSFNGTSWSVVYVIPATISGHAFNTGYIPIVTALAVYNGSLIAAINNYVYATLEFCQIFSSSAGSTWNLIHYASDGFFNVLNYCRPETLAVFGSNLYYAGRQAGSATRVVRKFNGTTFTQVFADTDGFFFHALYVWNSKIYVAGGTGGKIFSSLTGATWAEVADLGAGSMRGFIEYNSKLLVTYENTIYHTSDGLTWTLFYSSSETVIYNLFVYEANLYAGTSVAGKILVYVDATFIPAPKLKAYGNVEFYGQLRPNNAPGVLYNLLMSGGAGYPLWLTTAIVTDMVNTWLGGYPTNYTKFDAAGRQTAVGNARVLSELWVDAGAIRAPGAKPALEIAHGALETPAWQFSNEAVEGNQQTISFTFRVPLRMDISVAPTLCIGWSTTTVDPGDDSIQAKWQLEYLWTSLNESTAAAAQGTLPVLTSASTVAEGLMVSIFTGMDVPSATDICLHCRIKRLSADAQDTVDDTLELHGILLQFTSDKLGTAI